MPKQFNVEDLVKENPKLDLDQLAKGRKLFEDLRDLRVHSGQRAPRFPAGRRHVRIVDDEASDCRMTYISSRERLR